MEETERIKAIIESQLKEAEELIRKARIQLTDIEAELRRMAVLYGAGR